MRLFVSGSAPLPAGRARGIPRPVRPHDPRALRHERDADADLESLRGRATRRHGGAAVARRLGADCGRGGPRRDRTRKPATCRSVARTCSPATGATRRQPQAAFIDGWFRTGDIASRSADGYYTLCGRASDLIISSGFNVYPARDRGAAARAAWRARGGRGRNSPIPSGAKCRRPTGRVRRFRCRRRARRLRARARVVQGAAGVREGGGAAEERAGESSETSAWHESSMEAVRGTCATGNGQRCHALALRVLNRPLPQRRVVHPEGRRFGGRALDVPLVHDHPLDEPHRGRAAAAAAVDERRLVGRLRDLREEPIGRSGLRGLEAEWDVDVVQVRQPSPRRPHLRRRRPPRSPAAD